MELNAIQQFTVWVLPVLFAITLHEAAHGFVAMKFGDKTAFMLGRVSLNPLKHIDPVGTILVPAVLFFLGGLIFGWAKPVPVSWENLRHPKRDMALVALAGPLANLIMALGWGLIAKLGIWITPSVGMPGVALTLMGQAGILINLIILVLNLIPIPPLDGSRVVSSLLSGRMAYRYNLLQPYGFFILLALIFTGILFKLIGPPIYFLHEMISVLFKLN
jgi:Zn-dependent protease